MGQLSIIDMKKIVFLFFLLGVLFVLPAQAMTIISPIVELAAEPGQVQKGILKVYNETDKDLSLTARIEPFKAGSEDGQPIYLLPQQKDEYLSWFQLSQSTLKLSAKEAAIIPFEVVVPVSAVPGGYYAVVFWQELAEENKEVNNSTIQGKVGTLVFLQINGEFEESAIIKDFNLQSNKKVYFSLPLNFFARLENTGNIHLYPKAEIEIKNFLGQTKKFEMANSQAAILPQSIRRFETIYPGDLSSADFLSLAQVEFKNLFFGKLTAKVIFTYNDQNKSVSETISFWFFPWRLAVIFSGVLILTFLLFKINRKVNLLKKTLNQKK